MKWNDFLTWKRLQNELKELKEKELKLRKELCLVVLKDSKKFKKIEYNGWKIKATPKFSQKIDEATLNALWESLTNSEKLAIKMKPELVQKHFKKLPETSLIMQAITEKPGTPTLEMEQIKKD